MYEIKRPLVEATWKDMIIEQLAEDMVVEFDRHLVEAILEDMGEIEDEERL